MLRFQHFDNQEVPRNGDGDFFPSYSDGRGGEGGRFSVAINNEEAVSGNCLELKVENSAGHGKALYAQFNPYNYNPSDGLFDKLPQRAFAREYAIDAPDWEFNTYNRMRFWIKLPDSAEGLLKDGRFNYNVGTYVKRVVNPEPRSDEEGGGHFYHALNLPNGSQSGGNWVRVILNMHPSHMRGGSGGTEWGNRLHPTNEDNYNYFDALTRWYLQQDRPNTKLPATFFLDEIEFYRETNAENDNQVYSLAGVFNRKRNRLIVTWSRHKDENMVRHEVRYLIGPEVPSPHDREWENLKEAPDGRLLPQGWQGYNGIAYETTEIRGIGDAPGIWVAIKPENSDKFSAIYVRTFYDQ